MFQKTIDFVGKKKLFFSISIALVVITLIASFVMGVRVDIEFSGGAILTYSYEGTVERADVEKTVESALGEQVNVQMSKDVQTGGSNVTISIAQHGISAENHDALTQALRSAYPDSNFESAQISNVDATIGQEFFVKALLAVALAAVLMIVYIALRFKRIGGWTAGVTAVLALVHDMFFVYAATLFCGFSISSNFMAVILAILGYSINNTIVIYDRVRENRRLHPGESLAEVVNISITQSLTRAVHTTVTTVTALAVICIVALACGVSSILSFAFPMIVGMLAGVFSSLCIVGPLWVTWENYRTAKKAEQK